MREALLNAILITGYGMVLIVLVSSLDEVTIQTAFHINFVGGVFVFLFTLFVNRWKSDD